MILTKSQFIAGVQCLKRLYWIVHEPELVGESSASSQAIIEQGREVGLLARKLFPGGVTVEAGEPEHAIRRTRELIANPEVPAIFEGACENGGVFVRVDILHRRRDRRWREDARKGSRALLYSVIRIGKMQSWPIAVFRPGH